MKKEQGFLQSVFDNKTTSHTNKRKPHQEQNS
jgi:hypothetical protein